MKSIWIARTAGRLFTHRAGLAAALALFAQAFLVAPALGADDYEPPQRLTMSPTGVDLQSGRFTYNAADFSIGPFTLTRSYIGGNMVQGSAYFGRNWNHNYEAHVSEGASGVLDQTLVIIGRSTVHFMKYGTAYQCWNPDCMGSSLADVGGAFVYTDRDGNVYTFNPSVNAFTPLPSRRNQRVASLAYADGHTLTYTYTSSNLTRITSNRGFALVFEYNASGNAAGYVTRACGYNLAVTFVTSSTTCTGSPISASYSYAASTYPQLTSVTDVMNQVWGYDYLGNSTVAKMTCVRRVNSSSCLIANNFSATPYTLQQTTADGAVWNYSRVDPDPDDPPLPGEPGPHSEGNYDGPLGIAVSTVYVGGLLDSVNDNGRNTFVTWNGLELATLTHHEGNSVYYGRDARQNLTLERWTPKWGSTLTQVSRTFTFPDSGLGDCTSVVRRVCNKPISRRDYNQTVSPRSSDPLDQTDYTYDPAHGGVLTETGPAVNGVRPETRNIYSQRYAWLSNGAGGYVQAATPIWLQTAISTCRTSAATGNPAAPCAAAGDEVLTQLDYGPNSGPNTLLLRGQTVTSTDNGVTTILRTCYLYDALGRRISETQPNANLGSCP